MIIACVLQTVCPLCHRTRNPRFGCDRSTRICAVNPGYNPKSENLCLPLALRPRGQNLRLIRASSDFSVELKHCSLNFLSSGYETALSRYVSIGWPFLLHFHIMSLLFKGHYHVTILLLDIQTDFIPSLVLCKANSIFSFYL